MFEDDLRILERVVTVTPSMVKVGSTVAITATIDDTGKGDSWIQQPSAKVAGGLGPFAMTPVTTLDSKVEAFTASFAVFLRRARDLRARPGQGGNWGGWCA